MRGKTRKAVAGIAACGVALGLTVAGIVTFAGANEAKWTICKSMAGTAKTQSGVSLTDSNKPVGVVVALTATDCTAPNVNAVATNGPAIKAKVTGVLRSTGAKCELSGSREHPWGQLTFKWQTAAGAPILNSAGKQVIDKVYVRMEPEGVERYDLTGFATSGPSGGGDVFGELGLVRTTTCGTGSTKWNVTSSGTSGAGEEVGSDTFDDYFTIEVPLVLPSTTWDGSTIPCCNTFPPTTPTVSWYPSSVPTTTTTSTPPTTLPPES